MVASLLSDKLLVSLIYSLGFLFIIGFFGMIFSYVEKKNTYYIYNTFGFNGILFTGMVGTIVHEFSHIIFCLIFRHKITEFNLIRPFKSRYDGVMGYVNHKCNTNSKYQMIGNFFIGIAPVIVGISALIIFMSILLPDKYDNILEVFYRNMEYMNHINRFEDSFNIYVSIVIAIIANLNPFTQNNYVLYIMYIYIMYSITTHMDLSKEDLTNSKSGLLSFFILLYIINLIFMFLGMKYQIILFRILISIVSFLTVGLLFSIITLLISRVAYTTIP